MLFRSETVQDAVGVDITFTDKYGHEIQSAQGKSVAVSMTLNKAVEGEHFTVLHQSDDGIGISTVFSFRFSDISRIFCAKFNAILNKCQFCANKIFIESL